MRFEIKNIEPMGAVRMTTRGKYKDDAAQRYLSYKQVIYYSVLQQLKSVYDPIDGPIGITVWFYMPIPPSWPKHKKEAAPGQYHTVKPDVDNLLKGLFDAVNGLLWVDDNRVVDITCFKVYGEKPGIEFEIERLGDSFHATAETTAQKKTKQRAARQAESRAGRDIPTRIRPRLSDGVRASGQRCREKDQFKR